jgi:hypothetical protein
VIAGEIVFRARRGSRYTQEDIDIIGPALRALALSLKADLPQLTTKQVKDALLKDRENVLWGYIDTDPDKAMDTWIRTQVSHLISSVRYVRADIPDLEPQPTYETVKDSSLGGEGGTGRARVSAPDAYDKRGIATRIAAEKVLRVRWAVRKLHGWVMSANVPERFRDLARRLEDALTEFDEGVEDVAAE